MRSRAFDIAGLAISSGPVEEFRIDFVQEATGFNALCLTLTTTFFTERQGEAQLGPCDANIR